MIYKIVYIYIDRWWSYQTFRTFIEPLSNVFWQQIISFFHLDNYSNALKIGSYAIKVKKVSCTEIKAIFNCWWRFISLQHDIIIYFSFFIASNKFYQLRRLISRKLMTTLIYRKKMPIVYKIIVAQNSIVKDWLSIDEQRSFYIVCDFFNDVHCCSRSRRKRKKRLQRSSLTYLIWTLSLDQQAWKDYW